MALVVGPVIGLVTHNLARILIEVPTSTEVCITLTAVGHPPVAVTKHADANIAAVFIFSGLHAETKYDVTVQGWTHCPSKFTTFAEHVTLQHQLTFGIVSCNNYRITKEEVPPAGDAWVGLADAVDRGEISILLHLGDQTYGDDDWSNMEDGKIALDKIIGYCQFAQAMSLLEGKPFEEFEQFRHEIVEKYRQTYRDAWSHPPTRRALANCPSIMMYDDHELRDDLGDKADEHDLRSRVRFVVECGRVAVFEYQRQLFEDFAFKGDFLGRVPRENHIIHTIGEYGLLFVDTRGAKVFNRVEGDPKPFVTSAQWNDIYAALSPGGALDNCKILIMSTQIPIIFFPTAITERIAKKADDFEGMWSYKKNALEQRELLDLLFDWKHSRVTAPPQGAAAPAGIGPAAIAPIAPRPIAPPSFGPTPTGPAGIAPISPPTIGPALGRQREVYLCGGDVHLGGFSQVYKNGEFAFEQLICGPVSNRTINKVAFAVTNMVKEKCDTLDANWRFEHFGWTNMRNVGVIRTHPAFNYKDMFQCSHIIGGVTGCTEQKAARPDEGRNWWDSFGSFWRK